MLADQAVALAVAVGGIENQAKSWWCGRARNE